MLSCVAADYRTAGFDLLERLANVTPDLLARVVADQPALDGAVLLTTCNRFEAYLDIGTPADRDDAVGALLTAVADATGVPEAAIAPAIRHFDDAAAAGHLFAVSSGLESIVRGEGEIAGQVSRALQVARASHTTTAGLERVFQRAEHTSSTVQHQTGLGGAGRSVVRLALDMASSRVADWTTTDVLLIGTGRYAGATLAALRERGVTRVSVYSPSGRAARFAHREGVSPVQPDELSERLGSADVVIACSVATTPVLTVGMLEAARTRFRPAADRQLVIDLGLPRNVDPLVSNLEGVGLVDLETVSIHAPLPDFAATAQAQELVGQAVEEYLAAQQATAVTPAVVAFRAHVFDLVDAELERLRRRGEATEATERAMRHLASVLVHIPSTRARDFAAIGQADEFVAALDSVFGLGVATPAAGLSALSSAVQPEGAFNGATEASVGSGPRTSGGPVHNSGSTAS